MLVIHLHFFSSDILLSSPYFHQYSSDAPHQCSLLRKLLDFTLTTLVIYYHVRGKKYENNATSGIHSSYTYIKTIIFIINSTQLWLYLATGYH